MSENWPITEEGTLTIRQNAIFDFKQLYKLLSTFAEENNYKFNERNFTRKDRSDGSEYQIEWHLEREVTSFIKFNIDIEIWSLRTREIEQNGKKMYKGELEMTFDSVMQMDWQEIEKNKKVTRWERNQFTIFLRKIYIYYIKKQYFLNYASKLWEETYELHARVKAILNQFSLF